MCHDRMLECQFLSLCGSPPSCGFLGTPAHVAGKVRDCLLMTGVAWRAAGDAATAVSDGNACSWLWSAFVC